MALRRLKSWALCAPLCFSFFGSACAVDSGAPPVFEQRPYTGPLEVYAELPDTDAMRRSGRGGAEFQSLSGGRSRLVVYGDLAGSGRDPAPTGSAGFVMEGGVQDGSWLATGADLQLRIDTDGVITGGGLFQGDRYAFSGQLSADAFDLVVRIGPPADSRSAANGIVGFVFEYTLRHQAPGGVEHSRAQPPASARTPCRVVHYQPRMIANIGGDSMSTVQVPVCVG
ncbi:hypothetical protein J2X52_003295 [Luteimonas sp. 3794]|nr:hypothetical protein [Luteimonas sp. 3794]